MISLFWRYSTDHGTGPALYTYRAPTLQPTPSILPPRGSLHSRRTAPSALFQNENLRTPNKVVPIPYEDLCYAAHEFGTVRAQVIIRRPAHHHTGVGFGWMMVQTVGFLPCRTTLDGCRLASRAIFPKTEKTSMIVGNPRARQPVGKRSSL